MSTMAQSIHSVWVCEALLSIDFGGERFVIWYDVLCIAYNRFYTFCCCCCCVSTTQMFHDGIQPSQVEIERAKRFSLISVACCCCCCCGCWYIPLTELIELFLIMIYCIFVALYFTCVFLFFVFVRVLCLLEPIYWTLLLHYVCFYSDVNVFVVLLLFLRLFLFHLQVHIKQLDRHYDFVHTFFSLSVCFSSFPVSYWLLNFNICM